MCLDIFKKPFEQALQFAPKKFQIFFMFPKGYMMNILEAKLMLILRNVEFFLRCELNYCHLLVQTPNVQ